MQKRIYTVPLFTFVIALLIFAGLRWHSLQSWEADPRTKIDSHLKKFISLNHAITSIPIENIHSVSSNELTEASKLLPQSHRFKRSEIKAIFSYSKNCKSPPSEISNELSKALMWTQFLCGALKTLPVQFFNTPPFMHPAGYSYALKAAKLKIRPLEDLFPFLHRGEFSQLNATELAAISSYSNQTPWPLIVSKTDIESIDLLGRSKMWITAEQYVFQRDLASEQATYHIYERSKWDHYWRTLPLRPEIVSLDKFCPQEFMDLCWTKNKRWDLQAAPLLTLTSIILLLLSVSWIFVLYVRRKKARELELSERLLMLQLLTHELRTPVTTMGLDVEMLRKDISTLSSESQASFLRIGSSVQRLFKALKASQAYLATFTSGGKILDDIQTVPSINNFVSSQVDSVFGIHEFDSRSVTLKLLDHDRSLGINTEILGVCFRNIIENAKHHGKGKVSISVEIANNQILFQVIDEGTIDKKYLELGAYTSPFSKGNSSQGLGIGMFLVKTFIGRLGGKLRVTANPTMFELIVPVEERQSS